jgi:hypothetical protein
MREPANRLASARTLHVPLLALLAHSPVWAREAEQNGDAGPLGLLLLLPVALLSFAALELVLWVLAPAPLDATCRAIERGRGRCLLFGLLTAVVAVLLVSMLSRSKGAGELGGAILLGVLLFGGLVGLTAVTALLGQAVLELGGRIASRAVAVTVGAFLLGLVALFPLVGQVIGLYFLFVGLGGALLALLGPLGSGR